MKVLKITKTKMREAERNLSRHIVLLNDRFYQIEDQYLEVTAPPQGKKERAKGKALAKELVGIKLHVKELKQIVLDFEELG